MNNNLETEYYKLAEKMGFYYGRVGTHPLIPPEHVYFSLTNRCNLRCIMCDIAKNTSRVEDELTTAQVKDIVLQIKEMGIKHIIFSGGEPLLRSDLFEILEFAINSGIKMVDIITNGTLLTDDTIKKLVNLKLNHITISLDGLKLINSGIRGEMAFEKSERNIDKLNQCKAINNTSFPTLGINFTIMEKNIDDILPMVDFARSKKCNILVFQPILFNNTQMFEKKKSVLWPSEDKITRLREILVQLRDLKRTIEDLYIYTDDKILNALPDYFQGRRPGREFKCYEAIKRIVITYNGGIWSCMGIYGDLKKDKLKNIWFSEAAKKVRFGVKKCKEHCLQDCVYFPSQIYAEIKMFIRNIENSHDGANSEILNKLLERIDYYSGILSQGSGDYLLSPIKLFNLKKEIHQLNSMKALAKRKPRLKK